MEQKLTTEDKREVFQNFRWSGTCIDLFFFKKCSILKLLSWLLFSIPLSCIKLLTYYQLLCFQQRYKGRRLKLIHGPPLIFPCHPHIYVKNHPNLSQEHSPLRYLYLQSESDFLCVPVSLSSKANTSCLILFLKYWPNLSYSSSVMTLLRLTILFSLNLGHYGKQCEVC